MDHWFSVIAASSELPADSVKELDEVGFVVIPGPVAPPQLSRLAAVYDAAVSAADPADVGGGRTTTRVWDFVNRAPDFDGLYIYQPILEACCRVIGAPFHLSTMHARAVNPGAPAQDLHADYRRTTDGWTARRLTSLDERLIIPSCGLQCLVSDVYKGTPLTRRRDRL